MTGDALEEGHREETLWKPLKIGGFMDEIGPLLAARTPDGWCYGLDTDARHTNPIGLIHGGVTATLIDHALAMVAWEAANRSPSATVQMDIRYLVPAKAGQRLEAVASIRRQTASLLFVEAEVTAAGTAVAAASAILKPIRKSQGQAPETDNEQ